MTETELANGLRAWAKGNRGLEAAVELLVAHRAWLVYGTTRPPGTGDGPFEGAKLFYRPIDQRGVEVLDWAHARALTLPTSTVGTPQDRQILALALHLAGEAVSSLRHFLVGLDKSNLAIAKQAVTHYAGAMEATTDYEEAVALHATPARTETPTDDATTLTMHPGREARSEL